MLTPLEGIRESWHQVTGQLGQVGKLAPRLARPLAREERARNLQP